MRVCDLLQLKERCIIIYFEERCRYICSGGSRFLRSSIFGSAGLVVTSSARRSVVDVQAGAEKCFLIHLKCGIYLNPLRLGCVVEEAARTTLL